MVSPSARESMFLKMVQQYPDAAMGHFSLGKLYVEEGRYADAIGPLETAVRIDASYAAAWVSLGEAYAGGGQVAQARAAFERALGTAHAKRDTSLQADVQNKLNALPAT